jgi:hypothetical protein
MVARIVEFVCECGGRCDVKELIKALQGKKKQRKEKAMYSYFHKMFLWLTTSSTNPPPSPKTTTT